MANQRLFANAFPIMSLWSNEAPQSELTSSARPFVPTNDNGTAAASQPSPASPPPLQYPHQQMHAPSMPEWREGPNNGSYPAPQRRTVNSMLISHQLRKQLDTQNACIAAQLHPSDERYKEVPSEFHSLFPLDPPVSRNSHRNAAGSYGYPSHVYKVVSHHDGNVYALRRIENVRTNNDIATAVVKMWAQIQHAVVLPLHAAYVSRGALFFVHEYQPGAISLKSRYLSDPPSTSVPSSSVSSCHVPLDRSILLPEDLLWSYITQCVSALHSIHESCMAVRVLQACHVLMAGQNRIRIGGVGITDVLEYDSPKVLEDLQRRDLHDLGTLILSLATRRENAVLQGGSLDCIQQHYSPELNTLVTTLLSSAALTITQVVVNISSHTMNELRHQYAMNYAYEAELAKEYQNGRLLMLMLKLGLINERPDLNMDNSWSETGDRYLVKLFRDYVFHQVDESNTPIIDMGHVIDSLNKLDVGTEDKIVLSSRDGDSILLASYQDLKRCVSKSFGELVAMSAVHHPSPSHPPLAYPLHPSAQRFHYSSPQQQNASAHPSRHVPHYSSPQRQPPAVHHSSSPLHPYQSPPHPYQPSPNPYQSPPPPHPYQSPLPRK